MMITTIITISPTSIVMLFTVYHLFQLSILT